MLQTKKFLVTTSLGLFLSFIYFSYLVAKEKFTQLDFDLTVKFQDRISPKFDLIFSAFSVIGTVEVTSIIWLSLIILTFFKRYFLVMFSLMILYPLGLVIEVFGKVFVHHPGPPYLLYKGIIDFNFPTNFVQTDYSYPSGHIYRTSFLITFLILLCLFKWPDLLKIPLILGFLGFWVVMIVSRIYLGEHWTTDVLGGALLGTSLSILTSLFLPKKKNLTAP